MMEDSPASLPEAVLAQLTQPAGEGQTCSRWEALTARRRSLSVDPAPRQLTRLRSMEERLPTTSRRSSVVGNVTFSRKNSLCAPGPGKRFSLGPWTQYGRVSFSGLPLYQPIREIQKKNTYKTGLEPGDAFDPGRTQKVLEAVLRNYLSDAHYSAVTGGQLAQNLSDLIRSKMKEHCHPRYKVLCNVTLGQVCGQDLRVASRCLWDPQSDNFASAAYSNTTLFAVAMVHAIYYE